jgi:hypothetical protein
MDRKRALALAGVLALLGILVYLQFRTWRHFDWSTFLKQTQRVDKVHILHAIALIYLTYVLRAIRWKILLRPVRQASWRELTRPTIIGFTGLAVLGRPGELIRPYLIARRQNLPFSSQMGVWAVERIFDIGAYAVLVLVAIFFAGSVRNLALYHRFRIAGFVLLVLVAGLSLGAVIVSRKGTALAGWVEKRFAHLASRLGHRIAQRIREFGEGLNTFQNLGSFLQATGVSLLMWFMIGRSYVEVTHSYGAPLEHITVWRALLLTGSSMVGSLLQLPAVGGGSQLATIAMLSHVFVVPGEIAVSCGILLWLVTFVAVVPIGLLLAHQEHLSLRKLSQESQLEEASAFSVAEPPKS